MGHPKPLDPERTMLTIRLFVSSAIFATLAGAAGAWAAASLTPATHHEWVAPNCSSGCRSQPVAYIGETEKNRTGGTRAAVS
jgi:hypothetical protein